MLGFSSISLSSTIAQKNFAPPIVVPALAFLSQWHNLLLSSLPNTATFLKLSTTNYIVLGRIGQLGSKFFEKITFSLSRITHLKVLYSDDKPLRARITMSASTNVAPAAARKSLTSLILSKLSHRINAFLDGLKI